MAEIKITEAAGKTIKTIAHLRYAWEGDGYPWQDRIRIVFDDGDLLVLASVDSEGYDSWIEPNPAGEEMVEMTDG